MRCALSGVAEKEEVTLALRSEGSKALMVQTGEWLAQRPEATGSWGAQNNGRIVWSRGASWW